MIHTFVSFHVLPDKTEEFESLHRTLLELITAQPGCCGIDVHRSLGDRLEYMVHGRWESKQAWEQAHQRSDEFKASFKRLPVEGHNLSRASFFEPAYRFSGSKQAGLAPCIDQGVTP